MAQKNPSFVLEKVESFKFEDRSTPQLQSDHDVMVNVRYTGICGSDVHFWLEGAIGPFVLKEPMVLGHESSGVITVVGKSVTSVKVGDRVCMEPGKPCRLCIRCKEGKYNLCPDMRFAATPPIDGTLAKYYTLPEDLVYKLSDGTSLEEGAVVEPLSVAVHVIRQASVRPGQSVVVFGAGPVGLLSCAVAKAYGASKVVAVDINEERVKFAKTYAATHTVVSQKESAEDSAKRISRDCDLGLGADVVIDATGAEVCVQTGLNVARPGGTYVQVGMSGGNINFPIMGLCGKELNVKGSFRYGPGDYAIAVDLLSTGRVSVKELITKKVPFKEAESAFQAFQAAKDIKILIEGVKE